MIKRERKTIEMLKRRNILGLFIDCFDINPMSNKILASVNLVCAVFGDYSTTRSN